MDDEDLLAVRLCEILEARTHAVEMEAVERKAYVVSVYILNDPVCLCKGVDGCRRMPEELDRDAHAVFCRNRAHLLETFDGGVVDLLHRNLLQLDGRHSDDCLAADDLAPFAHLSQLVEYLCVVLGTAVVEEAQGVKGKRFELVPLEVGGEILDRVVLEIVRDAVHRARFDHVESVLFAEFHVFR